MADGETTMSIESRKPYEVLSLYCGLGGLDLGFIWEGFKIIWANDHSTHAANTHRLNFGTEVICRDVSEIPVAEIPDADIIIGGPPCQSFSLLGQRQKEDPRGKLVFNFLEIVQAKRPLAFVMENVPGIAASKIEGRRLPDVLRDAFCKLGYQVVKMNLTATDYLVPQLRKRLFLVGCLNTRPVQIDAARFAKGVYGINQDSFDLSAVSAIGDLGECVSKGQRAKYRSVEPSAFAKLMRRGNLADVSLHERPRMSKTDEVIISHVPPGGNYRDIPDEVAPGRVLKFKHSGGRTTTYGRLHPDKPSYTINTYFRRPNVGCNFHYSEPRLITPREAMRFQSIPDDIELCYGSQDQRNALIGNAVPPLMARAVAWSLRQAIEGSQYRDEATNMVAASAGSQLTLL
jgi:DNA (cytosine-5)-methyltransferase 1